MGMAIEMRMTMMVTTTIISTNVKPRRRWRRLPLCIGRSIGCLLLALGENFEYRLAAPTLGFGVVLGAAHAPFELVGERIAGDAAQEFQLGAVGVLREDLAFHQDFERFRVAVRTDFGRAEGTEVADVLVLVDGGAHGREGVSQVALPLRADLQAGERQRQHGEHRQDGDSHNHLHQRQSSLVVALHLLYHSEYGFPSLSRSRVLEYTLKTFSPPQVSALASSCMLRRPQSVPLVKGSRGTLRRNFIFFPSAVCVLTPSTRISSDSG